MARHIPVDEKSHTIDLTEKGRDLLSPDEQKLFILPDLGEEIEKIRNDESLSDEDKQLKEDEAHRQHQEQGESVHNINQLMRAYTLWEKDVQYMVTDDRSGIVDYDDIQIIMRPMLATAPDKERLAPRIRDIRARVAFYRAVPNFL